MLILWLGLLPQTTWLGSGKNIAVWLKTPVLVATFTDGDGATSCKKKQLISIATKTSGNVVLSYFPPPEEVERQE